MKRENRLVVMPSGEKDIEEIYTIEKMCFKTPWSRESLYYDITGNANARYLTAFINGKTVGYSGMWVILDEAHITNIAVHPEYRGRGVASALLEGLIKIAAQSSVGKMTLEVRVSNGVAINLYRKYGFFERGIRRGYYSDNREDALIMWKNDI